ncbi:hypothetical protein GGX14DRAFT_662824 [Mycena pura]|uniref:Uncharacterized protein n=1 Tax=Mycena pura TaxID=153505 RepID=A0AAD6YHM4_9AGAR|nr:hypothetical protein GGX14DRAFT_662824 [Mycena pura]
MFSTSATFLASLIALLPAAHALVALPWSMTNVPSSGLTDITFPLTIVQADHISGYYFAQQFQFINSGIGYTGIQPRPDKGGQAVLHGVFSSFVAGSTSGDPNCSSGADGGAGVSCSFEWSGTYGRTYNFEVAYSSGLWVGTAIDTVSGVRIHIGSFKLPPGAGGIASSQVGFVEWYPWNGAEPPNHCAKLPYQATIFGAPFTSHSGSKGVESLAYEYGDCVGQVAFNTQAVANGVGNNCGFRGQTGA